jgi:ABC-type branched-subunit amino acid transport system substrate-binding protein
MGIFGQLDAKKIKDQLTAAGATVAACRYAAREPRPTRAVARARAG